ncbi:Hypothetical_protein [Hexamita inflata]|uniref:Hypothetical_protein n=1 Tax=Hexamita inflata TaxID=28002 RepID=A0AA86UYA5_9EUKA|nr:Hypothetical protein HINF_LOCUS57016 [Hexamita inflata]
MFYSNKTNGITLTPHQVTATHSPPRWAKTGQGRVTIKIQHVNKATRSIKQVPAQIVEASHTIKNNRPEKNIMLLKLAIRNLIKQTIAPYRKRLKHFNSSNHTQAQ